MPKKHKVKLSKKTIREKYPKKPNVGEEIAQFASRLFLVFGFFIIIALSVDFYHLVH